MSSPFSTIEEFQGAVDGPTSGAIYTFAHAPIVNNLALLVAVGLFIWFIFRTFSTHYEVPAIDKSLNHLGVLLVAGMLSLVGAEYRQTSQPDVASAATPEAMAAPHQSGKVPLGLLGLTGVGLPTWRRAKSSRRKRLERNIKSLRS
ncbi:MAG: hypothetical protein ACFCVD_03555 [Nodosilinea sp.]